MFQKNEWVFVVTDGLAKVSQMDLFIIGSVGTKYIKLDATGHTFYNDAKDLVFDKNTGKCIKVGKNLAQKVCCTYKKWYLLKDTYDNRRKIYIAQEKAKVKKREQKIIMLFS